MLTFLTAAKIKKKNEVIFPSSTGIKKKKNNAWTNFFQENIKENITKLF